MDGEVRTPSSGTSERSRLTDPGPPPVLPPKPRPQISLKIPLHAATSGHLQTSPPRPMSFYYDPRMVTIPMTPVGNHGANHGEVPIHIPIPLNLVQAYPTKASEFMFKQFEGFRDFTMNTAKSGLSVGEKFSFWAYNKLRAWSRKWFTHFFLLLVIALYSLAGAAIFVAVEGSEEKKAVAEIRKEREFVIRNIMELVKQFEPESPQDEADLMGRAVQEMRKFEKHIIDHFKEGHIDKDDKPVWNFWSAVFYCGTVFTTIGGGSNQRE